MNRLKCGRRDCGDTPCCSLLLCCSRVPVEISDGKEKEYLGSSKDGKTSRKAFATLVLSVGILAILGEPPSNRWAILINI